MRAKKHKKITMLILCVRVIILKQYRKNKYACKTTQENYNAVGVIIHVFSLL